MSIEIQEALTMLVGTTKQIVAKVTPDNATDKTVTWTKTDPSGVITVSNGTVKAVKTGYAYVHAKAGLYMSTCYIKVSETKHLSSISPDIFWCQTGGWTNLIGDGRAECARTAIATMTSINTNSIFTPNDTVEGSRSITIYGNKFETKYCTNDDFVKEGIRRGFSQYTFSTIPQLLNALNNEINSGRAVVVHTNGSGEHWVTVTGTTTGKDATKFDELLGIDPWFNGSVPPNISKHPTYYTTSARGDGIQILSGNEVQNQNNFLSAYNKNLGITGYTMFTLNFD